MHGPDRTDRPDGDAGDGRDLLQPLVTTARAVFGAEAASVCLHDPATAELVFQAVCGNGESTLIGTGFPAGQGIAGFVLRTAETMIVEDVDADPTFARDVAESTAYVPSALMAAPVLVDGAVVGVLEVLDPQPQSRVVADLELLTLFAHQAGCAVRSARAAQQAGGHRGQTAPQAAELALHELSPVARQALADVLDALADAARRPG